MTQNNLGNAYSDRIRGERAENLEAAIAAYRQALEVCTRQAYPSRLGRHPEQPGQCLPAIASAGSGRRTWRRRLRLPAGAGGLHPPGVPGGLGHDPEQPGQCLQRSHRGERAENLEQAIAAYRQALEVRTREALPRGLGQDPEQPGQCLR